MSVTKEKDLFIRQIPQVEVDEYTNVPTAIFYGPESEFYIGTRAFEEAPTPLAINQDFKVDLGYQTAAKKTQATFESADGIRRSAIALTKDFLERLIAETDRWLAGRGVSQAASVLIAEPLQMHSEENSGWLQHYRKNLKDILEGRTFAGVSHVSFKNVDFIPEPFAAFQYYRYGVKHPLVTSKQQHTVLVLDFGGGTFDSSVIETTKEGNISWGGKNSLPLGCSSKPVGGYFINRKLVAHVLGEMFKAQNNSAVLRRALEVSDKVRTGKQDPTLLKPEMQNFVANFHRASFEIESAKIALCRQIRNWDLDEPLPYSVTVSLPHDFFSAERAVRNYRLSALEFREVFTHDIWNHELKLCLRLALDQARDHLQERPLNLVLLSGGSANIGWLEQLLRRDFRGELSHGAAEVLVLDDYQEVVAKGLAAECARRFATADGDGDFGSVTYNPVYLMLDVQGDGCRPRPFLPLTPTLPNHSASPGLLLESAHHLANLLEIPLQWRVKQIKSQPKTVDYFFSRSGLDIEDVEGRLNFAETKVRAPARCDFDRDLKVELSVREDGTATPRFIFKSGKSKSDCQDRVGMPFALDMTYAQADRTAKAYIGLDFGTSNSSVSYVEASAIRIYQERAEDKSWQELDQLGSKLPYPIALPLLTYLSESTNEERLALAARTAVESTISFLLFCAYQDYGLVMGKRGQPLKSRFFANFRQNSAGPAWGLLRQLCENTVLKDGEGFTAPLLMLFKEPVHGLLDTTVDMIAASKHDKADAASADWKRALYTLCNSTYEVFRMATFGFFEDLRRDPFTGSIRAHFRRANGQPPFHGRVQVELGEMPAAKMPFIFLPAAEIAIPLLPFMFWWAAGLSNEYDHGSLFLFDKSDDSGFEYKPIGAKKSLATSASPELAGLEAIGRRLQAADESPSPIQVAIIQS